MMAVVRALEDPTQGQSHSHWRLAWDMTTVRQWFNTYVCQLKSTKLATEYTYRRCSWLEGTKTHDTPYADGDGRVFETAATWITGHLSLQPGHAEDITETGGMRNRRGGGYL